MPFELDVASHATFAPRSHSKKGPTLPLRKIDIKQALDKMVKSLTILCGFFILVIEVTIGRIAIIVERNPILASIIIVMEFDQGRSIERFFGKYCNCGLMSE